MGERRTGCWGLGTGKLCFVHLPGIVDTLFYLPCRQSQQCWHVDHGSSGTGSDPANGTRRPEGWTQASPAAIQLRIGPIQPCQPILILGASWYLPTCQPSAISPGWHNWSAQTLFCRGFVVPESCEEGGVLCIPCRESTEMGTFPQRESPRRRFLLHDEVRRPVTSRHVRPLHGTVPCYLPWQTLQMA